MNYIKWGLTTFTTSILFCLSSTHNLAFGEPINQQKINYRKPSKVNHNIVYSQDIIHILIGARIITQFTPRDSQGEKIKLDRLASDLGYEHFNWVSYVEKDPHGILDSLGKEMLAPYNDPPAGGYQYDRADRFPFYWDVVYCDRCNQRHHFQNYNNSQQFALVFEDAPADYRLQPGEAVEFMTNLVGVKHINLEQNKAEWEILHSFRWKLTNPRANHSQVSLTDTNVDLSKLHPTLIDTMISDGAAIPRAIEVSNSN
ncbi:MAG: hypothetical protein ACFCAD_13365 [Pleurocapsa sp.]